MIEKRCYEVVDLGMIQATPDSIIKRALDDEIRERMIRTVEAEGPIMKSLLYKRVITSMSLKKIGSRIEPVFDEIAASLPFEVTQDIEPVYHNGRSEEFFRTAPESDRYSYQIPQEEAARCLKHILSREGRILLKSELAILFRDELGYDRMGAQVEALFSRASRNPMIQRTGNGRFRPE